MFPQRLDTVESGYHSCSASSSPAPSLRLGLGLVRERVRNFRLGRGALSEETPATAAAGGHQSWKLTFAKFEVSPSMIVKLQFLEGAFPALVS